MRRFRFTIAHLLLLVFFCGVGFAALRSASQLWANAWFSAALATLTVAVLAAVYRRGRRRAFWVGFASCGWVYLLLAFTAWFQAQTSPFLLTTAILDILYARIVPSPPPMPAPAMGMMGMMNGSMGSGMMLGAGSPGGMGGGMMPTPSPWESWTWPDASSGVGNQIGIVSLVSPDPFRRIGHSQFSLLFALFGGMLARRLHATREEPTG
jgi:hypothetical protein